MSEFVEPVGKRILVRKDESRQKTRGGIVLPDAAEIPTITGRVVEVSVQVSRDDGFPIRKYDKILFHPKNAIPVDFEPDNLLYVVPVDDVVAIFRQTKKKKSARRSRMLGRRFSVRTQLPTACSSQRQIASDTKFSPKARTAFNSGDTASSPIRSASSSRRQATIRKKF